MTSTDGLVRQSSAGRGRFRLEYVNLQGRAEPIRMLLSCVGLPFEDHRENFLEFSKRKDRLPLPKIPLLVVNNDVKICFANVILAYLGQTFGLEPESAEEQALALSLGQRIEHCFDVLKPFVNCLLQEPKNDQQFNDLVDWVVIPVSHHEFGPVFEKQLASADEEEPSGFVVGKKLTWIDFQVACFVDQLTTFSNMPDLFAKFPLLSALRSTVFALPPLQEYLQRRPETVF